MVLVVILIGCFYVCPPPRSLIFINLSLIFITHTSRLRSLQLKVCAHTALQILPKSCVRVPESLHTLVKRHLILYLPDSALFRGTFRMYTKIRLNVVQDGHFFSNGRGKKTTLLLYIIYYKKMNGWWCSKYYDGRWYTPLSAIIIIFLYVNRMPPSSGG